MVNLSSVCAAVDERDNGSAPTVQRRAIVTRSPPRAKGHKEALNKSAVPYRNDGASVVRSAVPRLR